MNSVLISRKSDNWSTPKEIYDYFIENGYYDPCPLYSTFNGLEINWKQKNFVNPPYSKLLEWVDKSISENLKGKEIYLLIPSRTDTKAFKSLYLCGADFYFITGRLKFGNKGCAPFPSLLVHLRSNKVSWRIMTLINRDDILNILKNNDFLGVK